MVAQKVLLSHSASTYTKKPKSNSKPRMGIMKSNLIILCLTVLGLSFLLPKSLIGQNQDSENPITVMSYNIRFDNPHDGPSAWPYRKNDVAKMIGPVYQVDIVGLQEVLRSEEHTSELQSRC